MKFSIFAFHEELTQGLTISVKVKKNPGLTWVKVPRAVGEEELRTTIKANLRSFTMKTSSYRTQWKETGINIYTWTCSDPEHMKTNHTNDRYQQSAGNSLLSLGNNKLMGKSSEISLPMWKTLIILIVGDQVIIHYNEYLLLKSRRVINQTLRTVASFMLHFCWWEEFGTTDDTSDSGNLLPWH